MDDNIQAKFDWYPIILTTVAIIFTVYCLFISGIVTKIFQKPNTGNLSELNTPAMLTKYLESGATEIAFDANDKITEIPNEIGTATSLQSLSVNNLQINVIPEFLGNLINLKKLTITNTLVSALPNQIANLTQLTYLDLSYNKFEDVPESIQDLKNLKLINLSGNKIPIESINTLKTHLPQTEVIY